MDINFLEKLTKFPRMRFLIKANWLGSEMKGKLELRSGAKVIDYSMMSFKFLGDVMEDYSIHFLSEIKGIIACETLGVFNRLKNEEIFNDFILLSFGGMPDRATRFFGHINSVLTT